MSYINIVMYGAVLPSYKSSKSKSEEKNKQEIVRADDPRNRERVRKIMEEYG